MVFSSLPFLYLFLPVVLILYFVVQDMKIRNLILLLASLFFYAWGEPKWIILMIISTFVEYVGALVLDRNRGTWKAKAAVATSVTVALSFLFIFKYLDFFSFNINTIFHTNLKLLNLTLPIGISFYTFQTITYIVDVYRGRANVQRKFFDLLLYVSMFPQLIAGPIVKYVDIEAQIQNRVISVRKAGDGLIRFLAGMFKKVLLANVAGEVASTMLDGKLTSVSVVGAWIGLFAYTFQIYFDFSAYSDMAIGLGKMLGFDYPENFNYPYTATSISDFWNRWHMSLTTFFREYVYIPLGGNRKHHVFNLFFIWFLTGFWHGASWNFIIWGLYYFVLIVCEKLFLGRILERRPAFLARIYTMFMVILGWGLFYFDDMDRLRKFFSVLFGFGANGFYNAADGTLFVNHILFFLLAILAVTPLSQTLKRTYRYFVDRHPSLSVPGDALLIVHAMALLFVNTAAMVGSTYNPFLYFRF